MYQSLLKFFIFTLFYLSGLSSAFSQAPRNPAQSRLPLPAKTNFQLGPDTWIENIAVRSNNDLLLTVQTSPDLYTLSPSIPNSAKLLHTFPNATSLTGITETSPDIFAVVAGNYSFVTGPVPCSYSVWQVDFSKALRAPTITKITDIPEALNVNGMTSLPASPTTVLIADSTLGLVFRLDTIAGEYDIAIKIPEMAPNPNGFAKVGINGLHTRGHHLYFTNSFDGLYRILITPSGSVLPGAKAESLGLGGAKFLDDFALDKNGNAWAMANIENEVVFIRSDGRSEVVVGSVGSLTVAGCTAGAFGRGVEREDEVLYVTTSGGLAKPVNGTVTEGAKVVAVDTWRFDPSR